MQTPTTARQIRRRIAGLRAAVTRWERRDWLADLLWSGVDRHAQIAAARAEIGQLERRLTTAERRYRRPYAGEREGLDDQIPANHW